MVAWRSVHDAEIRRLAVPALGALVAEPLFLATDTALVGHLGAVPLAGLGIAATVLQTALGLTVFLAYATTPLVARRLGAGDRAGAVAAGVDGMWLGLGLGAALGVLLAVAAPRLAGAFGAAPAVTVAAAGYLRVAALGLPGMLLVTAATGLFRGLQDTRTPLLLAGVGFAANAGLNAVLIYPARLGLAGSAWGTALAQSGMAVAAVLIAVRAARAHDVGLRPGRDGLRAAARLSGWLFVRNLTMRVVLVGLVVAAAAHGTVVVAAVQAVSTVFSFGAFALDALAIAGQAMVGRRLGAGDRAGARELLVRMVVLAAACGLGLGVVLAACAGPLAAVFTDDPGVRAAVSPGLLVVAAGLPLGGVVWALDGVLIGAGDGRYLASAGVANLVGTVPLLILAARADLAAPAAVVALMCAFSLGYMAVRLLTLGPRALGDTWLRVGV